MISIKPGVTPRNLYILAKAAEAAQKLKIEIVVTSGTDGVHMSGSKHYTGEALDFRRWNLSSHQLAKFCAEMVHDLGPDYDVVLESSHIHVEYDPKPRRKEGVPA